MTICRPDANDANDANDTNDTNDTNDANDANAKVVNDVIESQTSKNIQAAGKLTTTASPKQRKEKSDPYECPNTSEFSFFPHYCSRHANCLSIGKEYRCCRQFNSKRCVKGAPKPLREQRHERNLNLYFFFSSFSLFTNVLFSQHKCFVVFIVISNVAVY